MIYTKCYDRLKPEEYDEIWMIVRSWKEPVSQMGDVPVRHVPELSPSRPLLDTYIELRDKGEWDYEKFVNGYLPRFLNEFDENKDVTESLLDELCAKDKEGKNVCLVCFCDDERLCHRSIVAGLLKNKGASVVTETGDDYTNLMNYRIMYSALQRIKEENGDSGIIIRNAIERLSKNKNLCEEIIESEIRNLYMIPPKWANEDFEEEQKEADSNQNK